MAKSKAQYVQLLAGLRSEAKLTQEQLSKRSGVSLGRIRAIETGTAQMAAKERRALARALKVKVNDLLYPSQAGIVVGCSLLGTDIEEAYFWLGIDAKMRRDLATPCEGPKPEWAGRTTLKAIFGDVPSGWHRRN